MTTVSKSEVAYCPFMKSMAPGCLLVMFVFASALAAPALAQPRPGSFFVRGSMGEASKSLNDWNDEIRADHETYGRSLLGSGDLPGGIPLGVEAGYNVSERYSVAVAFTYQKSAASGAGLDPFTSSYTSDHEIAVLGWTASVSVWVPKAAGLFLAADVGAGFGTAKSETHFVDDQNPANSFDTKGEWDGVAPIGGVFVGYQWIAPEGDVLAFVRGGYRFQNLGELDGTVTSPQLGSRTGPPLDNAGQPIGTDYSGFQLVVGLGYAFGGK